MPPLRNPNLGVDPGFAEKHAKDDKGPLDHRLLVSVVSLIPQPDVTVTEPLFDADGVSRDPNCAALQANSQGLEAARAALSAAYRIS